MTDAETVRQWLDLDAPQEAHEALGRLAGRHQRRRRSMTDHDKGTWTLTLAVVEPGNIATFETGSGDWTAWPERDTISFTADDGTRVIYPWSALLSARFVPASRANGGTA